MSYKPGKMEEDQMLQVKMLLIGRQHVQNETSIIIGKKRLPLFFYSAARTVKKIISMLIQLKPGIPQIETIISLKFKVIKKKN